MKSILNILNNLKTEKEKQKQVLAQKEQQRVNKVNNDRFAARALSESTPKKSASSHVKMNLYDKLNSWGQRAGEQVWRSAFGNEFVDSNNKWQRDLSKSELKKNPNDAKAKKSLLILNDSTRKASTTGEKTLNYIGGTVGTAAPYLIGDGALGAAEKGATAVTKGTVQKALTNIVNPAKLVESTVGKKAIHGAMSGLVGGAVDMGTKSAMSKEHFTPKQVAENLAITAGMGAGGNVLFHGLGVGAKAGYQAGLKKLVKGDLPKFDGNVSPKTVDKISPKQTPVMSSTAKEPITVDPATNVKRYHDPLQQIKELVGKKQKDSPLLQMAKKTMYEERTLPDYLTEKPVTEEKPSLANTLKSLGKNRNKTAADFGSSQHVSEPVKQYNQYGVEVPYDKVEHAPTSYWKKRYEDFAAHVNKNYNSNNLSEESLNELWTHFAKPDEPVNLHELVDLAYKPTKETPVLDARNIEIKRPPASQKAKDIIGLNDTAFKLPNEMQNKPIDATEVWDKMGNRPPVSQNAKKILGLDGNGIPQAKKQRPIQEVIQELSALKNGDKNPVQQAEVVSNMNIPEKPINTSEQSPVQPQIPKQPGERAFYNTVGNSDKITPEMAQKLAEFDKSYTPMSNEELVNYANDFVEKDPEKAYQFVKNAKKFDPRHITVGHRLIDELQKTGQYDRALDVVDRLAEQGTKAGQSIQSYSIYNRLSVEGQLLRAQRRVNQINEGITDPTKQVKLTPDIVENIAQTADSIKRFTGQEEQANNVMSIMENIKKGNHPTDAELETVRSFVADAKQFVGDLTPGAEPAKPKTDVRNRDKVVDFMSKREEVARERLKARMNRANSLPVDVFYDLSIIGASKIAKGTVKVADFTEEMVSEFGDMVRPYAQQLYNKAVETFNLQSETMTRQRLSEVEKITNKALKDKNLAPDEVDSIREFARQVAGMTGDAKLESSMELQATLQALERPTFGQKISAAQTIAQLLNPKTIVRNAIGNELFYRVEQINKLVATPIDMAKSALTGSNRTVTFRSFNQGQYWKNWMTGAKAGWKGVNPMGLTTAYDLGPQSFRSKYNPLTYMEKALGATLRSFDHAGYMRAYNKTIGELANLRAINEGLTGQEKREAVQQYARQADENMMHIADAYGKYATFQDTTALSNALSKVKKGMNKVSTLGATDQFGLGDLVLKYPKTPGNLIMRALEYSPAGFIRSAQLARSAFKTKNPFQERDAVLSFTRAIIGTGGFSLLGYVLADKGILTSSGSSDYEVSSLEKNAGKQPNSVNISALSRFFNSGFNLGATGTQEGDRFVSYDWAQPLSIAVSLGTGVSQSVKDNGELSLGGAVKGAADSASNTIIQQSVLKGLNDFLANYPGRTMSDRVGDAGKGIAGSFVPTLLNQVRQTNDNTSRSAYDPSVLKEILNRATNRVPRSEKSLPASYDTLGNKKQNFQNGSNNAFNVFLNPSFVSQYKPSPEAKFVLDYINKTGDKSVAPRMAQKKLDGQPLTGQQYSEMQRIMGEETQKGLQRIVPNLQGESNPEKIKKGIDKILMLAGKTAREQIRKERSMNQ